MGEHWGRKAEKMGVGGKKMRVRRQELAEEETMGRRTSAFIAHGYAGLRKV